MHTHIYIYIYTYIHIHTDVDIAIDIYIYMYVCIGRFFTVMITRMIMTQNLRILIKVVRFTNICNSIRDPSPMNSSLAWKLSAQGLEGRSGGHDPGHAAPLSIQFRV